MKQIYICGRIIKRNFCSGPIICSCEDVAIDYRGEYGMLDMVVFENDKVIATIGDNLRVGFIQDLMKFGAIICTANNLKEVLTPDEIVVLNRQMDIRIYSLINVLAPEKHIIEIGVLNKTNELGNAVIYCKGREYSLNLNDYVVVNLKYRQEKATNIEPHLWHGILIRKDRPYWFPFLVRMTNVLANVELVLTELRRYGWEP